MKSIVDKLVSRIDAIEQSGSTTGGNQGESGEVKEHTHTVEQITDLDTSTFVKNSDVLNEIPRTDVIVTFNTSSSSMTEAVTSGLTSSH